MSSQQPSYLTPIPLPPHIKDASKQLPKDVNDLATYILSSLKSNTQIPRLSITHPQLNLDQATAYQTTASTLHRRIAEYGENPVGRKIGFTNKGIWPEYGIDRSNWSYVYDKTVIDLDALSKSRGGNDGGERDSEGVAPTVDLSPVSNLEPRIEPEIILGIHDTKIPTAKMSTREVLSCISWIAPGFEIVVSPWKEWKFSSAETTAAFALHGRLIIGSRVPVSLVIHEFGSAKGVLEALEGFTVELSRNGEVMDRGVGRNVLGSPVRALGHLVELLEGDGANLGLAAGEVVTTGTLTRALDIGRGGENWRMRVDGLGRGVEGVECRFVY